LSGSIHVNQSGGNLVVTQGTATFTGDLETNGAFTIVGVPNVSTAASCTYALTAGYGGNFLSNIVVFVVLATKVSGDCTGVSLPCSIGYSGSINKLAAQMALQQQDNVSPADAVRAIIEATQAQAH